MSRFIGKVAFCLLFGVWFAFTFNALDKLHQVQAWEAFVIASGITFLFWLLFAVTNPAPDRTSRND